MSKKNFQLRKVKFRKDLGLDAEFSNSASMNDNEVVRKSIIERCNAAARPDLHKTVARLRPHFAAIHGFLPIDLVKKELSEMTTEEQSHLQAVVEAITITSVTMVGTDDEDAKFIISASREILPNGFVGFATPTIARDDNRYELSAQLTDLIDDLKSEVYEYVINKQYAQLSMELEFSSADSDDDEEGTYQGEKLPM